MFDVKALHLGHLAKAFALRERPGGMGRGGAGENENRNGGGSGSGKRRRRVGGEGGIGTGDGDGKMHLDGPIAGTDAQDAARKMRMKMKEQARTGGGASEFNIG